MSTTKRLSGRPAAAVDEHGRPEFTSLWEQVSCRLRPRSVALLDGLRSIDRRPLWQIFEDMLLAHVANLPPEDRKVIHAVAERRLASVKASASAKARGSVRRGR